MKVGKIAGSIIETALRIIVLCIIVMAVYSACLSAYDFGFRIFAERPVTEGNGRDVKVTIPQGSSASDIGKILEDKGLITDSKLFFFQELLSSYHGKMQAGTYTFNTSETPTQMMKIMSEDEEETSEEEAASDGEEASKEDEGKADN